MTAIGAIGAGDHGRAPSVVPDEADAEPFEDRSGKTFGAASQQLWRFWPPKGTQFALAMPIPGEPPMALRRVGFTAARLQTWWSTLVLWEHYGSPEGGWVWQPRFVADEILRWPRRVLWSQPKTSGGFYERPSGEIERRLRDDFAFLEGVLITGWGDLTFGKAQRLLTGLHITKGKRLLRVDGCLHSQLVMMDIRRSACRIPRRVFQLEDVHDIPVAYELALCLRRGHKTWSRTGQHSIDLHSFGASIGVDTRRRDDRTKLVERLVRVIVDAGFGAGAPHVSGGCDPPMDADLTFEPSDTIGASYQPLADARERHRALCMESATREVAAAEFLATVRRGRGRPPAMPAPCEEVERPVIDLDMTEGVLVPRAPSVGASTDLISRSDLMGGSGGNHADR
jgi:hypothetical protein